jgi:hypothetical protein
MLAQELGSKQQQEGTTMIRSRRLVLAAILVAVVVLGSALPALAETYPGCSGFDVQVDNLGGDHLVNKLFYDRDGNLVRFLQAGKGDELTFTNLATGDALTTPANGGVTHLTFNADGTQTLVVTGHYIVILFPSDTLGPSTTLYVGRAVITIDPNGIWTLVNSSGTKTDICAALSG